MFEGESEGGTKHAFLMCAEILLKDRNKVNDVEKCIN